MISKLPRWVWMVTWVLAFIAGIVNVVGLLGYGHEAITHLTGNTSRLAEAIGRLDLGSALHFGALAMAFVTGALVSGLLIEDTTLHIDRKYSLVLLLESLLLLVSVPLLKNQSVYGMYCAACASGLQNAMVTTYSGAVVRTTHLSGMFTDLGISLGHALRGRAVSLKRLALCFLVISGFLSGGIVGTVAFQVYAYRTLFISAGLTAVLSAIYGLSRTRKIKQSVAAWKQQPPGS